MRSRDISVLSGGFDSASVAYFAAMTTQEPTGVKIALDRFIRGVKTDGLWSLIDGGNILALGTSQSARVDFKAPTRVATLGGSPVFTAYRGFTGSALTAPGSPDSVNVPFTPSTAGGVYTLNSAHFGIWITTNTGTSAIDAGANGTNDAYIRAQNAGSITTRLNDVTNATAAVATSVGFSLISRTSNTGYTIYKNGVSIATPAVASVALPNAAIQYLQTGNVTSTTNQIAAGVYGAGLDATQAAALYARMNTLISTLTVI